MASLFIVAGPLAGRRLRVDRELLIGREAELSLDEPEVSRHHTRLRATTSGLQVEDLGSTNGTFVNGRRVQGTVLIRARDELRIGTTIFRLEEEGPARVPTVPPATAPASFAIARPRRRIASRQAWPTVVAIAGIVATSAALVLYFATRGGT